MKNHLSFFVLFAFAVCTLTTNSFAEESSMWQKFVNFFNPSPTLEGEGPLYDELKQLDEKIYKTEGKYSRERRPGNKTRLKKEIEKLRAEREALVQKITAAEKNKASANASANGEAKQASAPKAAKSSSSKEQPKSSSVAEVKAQVNNDAKISTPEIADAKNPAPAQASPAASVQASAVAACAADTVIVHDTVTVTDTVVVHDTLYVIVADKPAATDKSKPGAGK